MNSVPSDKRYLPPSKSRRPLCSIRGRTRLLALDLSVAVTSGTSCRTVRRTRARRSSSFNGSQAAKLSLLLFHSSQRSGCYNITSHLSRPQLRPISLELQASGFLHLVCPSTLNTEMESACHNDSFFGPAVTGCRGNFDFTIFFEATILSILPSALFILLAPWRFWQLKSRSCVVTGQALWYSKAVSCGNCPETIFSALTWLQGLHSSLR